MELEWKPCNSQKLRKLYTKTPTKTIGMWGSKWYFSETLSNNGADIKTKQNNKMEN